MGYHVEKATHCVHDAAPGQRSAPRGRDVPHTGLSWQPYRRPKAAFAIRLRKWEQRVIGGREDWP
jgi:hypothetical protein